MKPKQSYSFAKVPGPENEREKASKKEPSKKSRKRQVPRPKTSCDPLYDTTDKYKRVIKPMKIEDFLQ